jgi:HSP20 family protein
MLQLQNDYHTKKEVVFMDITRLNPWNWFSREEEQFRNVPVQRGRPQIYGPLWQLHEDIDRMFENVFRGFDLPSLGVSSLEENSLFLPHVDIASTDKDYTITVEVPGVDEKDVKLELSHDGTLTIRGEKRQEKEHKDRNFYRVERSYGSFQRILSLPEDAAQEKIDAAFNNGVLTITCPRQVMEQTPVKRIDVRKAA